MIKNKKLSLYHCASHQLIEERYECCVILTGHMTGPKVFSKSMPAKFPHDVSLFALAIVNLQKTGFGEVEFFEMNTDVRCIRIRQGVTFVNFVCAN